MYNLFIYYLLYLCRYDFDQTVTANEINEIGKCSRCVVVSTRIAG
jgi:hypothetical protein